jgi:RND family efflux transporter MFP subunit
MSYKKNVQALSLATGLLLGTIAQAQQTTFGEVFVVQASDRQPTVTISGTVVPYKEVTLAAQLPGRVKYIAGIEGDSFTKDTQLVAIDETELLAKRSSAYAQLSSAQAQLRNADVQYSRELWSPQSKSSPGGMGMPAMMDNIFARPAEDMFGGRDRGAERSADLYASSTRIEEARNAMLRAQSEIQAVDAKLRDAKSLAPFAGVIIDKMVEVGDTVQPGQAMLKFADITWLQVEVDIPARLVTGLQEMMVLKKAASFDDYAEPVDVRIAQIYPMADARRHTIKVKLDVPQGISQPGMYAKVQIPDTGAASARGTLPVVPHSAIRYRGSLPVVYVQNTDGKAELRLIREGRKLANGMVTVLSGLAPGDKIFANPGPGARAGN